MAESITVRASKERLANYRHFLHGVLSSSDELSQRQVGCSSAITPPSPPS